MLQVAQQRNKTLHQKAEVLSALLVAADVPPELEPYKEVVLSICDHVKDAAHQNLDLIDLRLAADSQIKAQPAVVDFAKEVIKETEQAVRLFQLVNEIYAAPILRAAPYDRLSLYILGWLHRTHPQTRDAPPVIINQPVAVNPLYVPKLYIPIYYFPVVEQRGLLYQPLKFHEYGHVLYSIYDQEMDDLVKELKEEILDFLNPSWSRGDPFDAEQLEENQAIADTWYSWIQELFCDAVGFHIGGPAYLCAFSNFLNSFSETDFHREPDQMRRTEHPVLWLRVYFLQRRAEKAGFEEIAHRIVAEWESVAQAMNVQPDYHGYYDARLDGSIEATLDEMIEVADPRPFQTYEVSATKLISHTTNPIEILNVAWHVYLERPDDYPKWERDTIQQLLATNDN